MVGTLGIHFGGPYFNSYSKNKAYLSVQFSLSPSLFLVSSLKKKTVLIRYYNYH